MRVMFIDNNQAFRDGLPNGFRAAGHEVLVSGRLTEEYLAHWISEYPPDLVISIGNSDDHTPQKHGWIRHHVKSAGIPLVYWATEDPDHVHEFSLKYFYEMGADFMFTVSPFLVGYYREIGIPAAHLPYGYEPSIHFPTGASADYHCTIAVVALAYPAMLDQYQATYAAHCRIRSLQTLISPLVSAGIRVDFWGLQWEQMEHLIGCPIPPEWIRGQIFWKKANAIYSSSDIVIGFQNNASHCTMRTFEVLASGGFLLTLDTPAVRELFLPGRDLVVSASPQETLGLVRYYLDHPEERDRVRVQGYQTVAPHTNEVRAKYMVSVLCESGVLKLS